MEELDLKELISMFLSKKILIILVVIIFALIGAIYTLKFITPMYQSSTSLVLVQAGLEGTTDQTDSITTTDITLNSKLVENYREIATSKSVAKKVISELNLNVTVEELQDSVSVSASSDAEILKISVSNQDPEQACIITNKIAEVFIENVETIYKVSNVTVLDEAEVELEPYNVNLVKNIVIFAIVGLVIVLGYILLINMLDTTVKTDADIEKALKVPVLASIALTDENAKKKSSNGRRTRTSIEFEREHQTIKAAYEYNNLVKEQNQAGEESMFDYMNKNEKGINKNTNNNSNKKRNNSSNKGGKK
jgi:capsular polysaccharide biosynthesis protein